MVLPVFSWCKYKTDALSTIVFHLVDATALSPACSVFQRIVSRSCWVTTAALRGFRWRISSPWHLRAVCSSALRWRPAGPYRRAAGAKRPITSSKRSTATTAPPIILLMETALKMRAWRRCFSRWRNTISLTHTRSAQITRFQDDIWFCYPSHCVWLIRNQTAWNTVKLILLDMFWLFSSFKVMNVHAKIQHKVTKKQKTFIVDYQRLKCKIHENQYEFTHNTETRLLNHSVSFVSLQLILNIKICLMF